MKPRNAATAKSAAAKKTPLARKSSASTSPNPPPDSGTESATPKTRVNSKPQQPVAQARASDDSVVLTPKTKVAEVRKTIVRKVMVRTKTPTSAKAVSRQKPKSGETGRLNVEESVEKEVIGDAKDVDSAKKKEFNLFGVGESLEKEEHSVENVEGDKRKEDQDVVNVEELPKDRGKRIEAEPPLVPNVGKPTSLENPVAVDVRESLENQEPDMAREENKVKEDMKEHTKTNDDKVEIKHVSANTEEDINNELKGEDTKYGDEYNVEDRMEECSDRLDLKEFGEEELVEDDIPEQGEGAKSLEEEHMELTAAAKEHKIRKELEIFVGGLDHDAVEEDVCHDPNPALWV